MKADDLRAAQAPLKERYRTAPEAAHITLRAEGRLAEGVSCKIETGKGLVTAGLHPATGGSGLQACSGDMLLEALVACAGVTLGAVATALGIELRDARLQAEGDLTFAEPSECPRKPRWDSGPSACSSRSTPMRRTIRWPPCCG